MPAPLLELQELRVDGGGGLGGCAQRARGEPVLRTIGDAVELLVVVLLQRDLYDSVVLYVPLLSHSLQVAVGSPTQPLECSGGGGGEGGRGGREGGIKGGREGREGVGGDGGGREGGR